MTDDKPAFAPEDAWEALQRVAVDDEAERVLALSGEELDAELARYGVDGASLRRDGVARRPRAGAMRRARAAPAVWGAAALSALATAAAIAVVAPPRRTGRVEAPSVVREPADSGADAGATPKTPGRPVR